jgi:hypothetical protein
LLGKSGLGWAGVLAIAAVVWGAHPAEAAPTTVCTIADPRLDELSGLIATPDGLVAMNDGKPGTEVLRLYVLNSACKVVRVITDRSFDPFDPEDLGRTSDGVLWVADVGDNNRTRSAPAINRIPPGAARGTKYQLRYPDGAHDAEALLMQRDGTAVIVTKEVSGVARVFVTTRPLAGPAATVPLRDAGSVTIPMTDTPGGPISGGLSSVLVTGGAVAPDGRKVVIRTYTDAYEWDVKDGDIAAALVGGTPRRAPLPGEPQGEAISFTADGAAYVTASEGRAQPLHRWARASTPVDPPSRSGSSSPSGSPSGEADGAPPASGGIDWSLVGLGALAAVGLAAVGLAAVVGGRALWRRVRRR